MSFERYNIKSLEDLDKKLKSEGIYIPICADTSILATPLNIGSIKIANRLACQPMEGCDGTLDGKPGELTLRRYERFANGGAGLIWFEATATMQTSRANPRQLMLNKNNMDSYKSIVDFIKTTCYKKHGFEPIVIIQLTHSGRYSKPDGIPAPIIAYNNPLFEGANPISENKIIKDEEIEQLEDSIANAAYMSQKCGFDGADIKSCHRYLGSELLSAYNRKGKYGGSLENRSRYLLNTHKNASEICDSNFILTTRLNVYDGFPYPYGFGVSKDNGTEMDLAEPLLLIDKLHKQGMKLINITIGNPYVNPHVNRPYDSGSYLPEESALLGVSRILEAAGTMQKSQPDMFVMCSGLSYLREFSANVSAGMVQEGLCSIAGFGRECLAYPDFASDIINTGKLNPKKCCITCGKCTELMRNKETPGCVIRDKEVYGTLYSKCKAGETL